MEGLPIELRQKGFQAQAGGDVTALGDHRSLAGGLAPVVQTEDRGYVNPVPAFDFFALLPQRLSLAPVIALADVPGVDFDDQGEGLTGRSLGITGQLLQAFLAPVYELAWPFLRKLLSFRRLLAHMAMP